jgi:hypothetical protein
MKLMMAHMFHGGVKTMTIIMTGLILDQRHPVWDYMTTRAAYYFPEEILPKSLAREIKKKGAAGVGGILIRSFQIFHVCSMFDL